jgi:hypothetical protein
MPEKLRADDLCLVNDQGDVEWYRYKVTQLLDAEVAPPKGFRSGREHRVEVARDHARWIAAMWPGTVDGRPATLEFGFWREPARTGYPLVAYGGLSSGTPVPPGVRTIGLRNRTWIIEPVEDDARGALRAVMHVLKRGTVTPEDSSSR